MTERRYANTTCPYCESPLEPLPKAKKKCPSCGQAIRVRSGPDGFTYPLQEADLPVLERAWEEHHSAIETATRAESDARTAVYMAETLAGYARRSVRVEFFGSEDACPTCRTLHGRVFDAAESPPIPVPGCAAERCRCDWLPRVD